MMRLKAFLQVTAFWAVGALVVAALVVGLGLYNVSARKGHLPGVYWLLQTTYVNSVKLRAPSEEVVPDLSDPDLIALGARHYELACSRCHGKGGTQRDATALSMVPEPPDMVEASDRWAPRQLFWIIRNGVKMSGMPSWPSSQRDDDIWPVVAFVNSVESANQADVPRATGLAGAAEDANEAAIYRQRCAICHGTDGSGPVSDLIPRLDILTPQYLAATLQAYRAAERQSGIMQHVASTLSDSDIAGIATFLNSQDDQPVRAAKDGQTALAETGRRLATGSPADRDVPACAACHGPWQGPVSELYPAIAGQSEAYLLQQLKLWKSETRGGLRRDPVMHYMVAELTEDQMRALAAYYASLAPQRPAASDQSVAE